MEECLNGGIAPPFLTSALHGGEWSASRFCRFNHRGRALGTYSIGGWVSPRVCLEAVEKRNKSLALSGNRTPIARPSSPLSSASGSKNRLRRQIYRQNYCKVPILQDVLQSWIRLKEVSLFPQAVFQEPRQFVACMFSEIAISGHHSRAITYKIESMEGLSVETLARNGNCKIFPIENLSGVLIVCLMSTTLHQI
jgi:hypothetical protein